ncbi:MAG TPA: AAA family ATPase [Gaiellaceae bacterium]|nr:AAA family ATPase [Gaiellaceae bacterium]
MPQRKTVTVLFADVVGSTSLGESHDPETTRSVLDRFFAEARTIVERHGGSVEKFIGDAVVALFGVPVVHEDDALRGLRAADELRAALERLNESFARVGIEIELRMGVNTGVVVVDESRTDGFRASGDPMNVAARLEQSAEAGEILIGSLTRDLGGEAIEVEEVPQLDVRGKARPLSAYRLIRVLPDVDPYRREGDAPVVGREHELELLAGALRDAVESKRCVSCAVVGPPGIGKSRLIREFVERTGEEVQALAGRCPAYGEGVTFLPLAEALQPLLGDDPTAVLLDLLGDVEWRESAAAQVEVAVGLRAGSVSAEEAFAALRVVLEALARRRPLVLVVDDVHWAEPHLLDFLEYLAATSSDGPILLVCTSRPELVDQRPSWTAPRDNTLVIGLRPLGSDDAAELVRHLRSSHGLRTTEISPIVEAADGNPLFLEQLLALNAGARPNEKLVVPPTIQALLAARLDQLDGPQRRVVEAASIEGRFFRRAHVEALVNGDGSLGDVDAALQLLARRQFVRPVDDPHGDDDVFAFVHALVRDAAYSAVSKARRAALHVRLAEIFELEDGSLDEIVGHHLEDAARLRLELGRADDETRSLEERAGCHLLAGGERALGLGDNGAAIKLLERAVGLVGADSPEGRIARLQLGSASAGAGRLQLAEERYEEVISTSRDGADRVLELRARVALATLEAQTDVDISMAELEGMAMSTLEELEALGDERGLASAWYLVHWARFRRGRFTDAIAALERVADLARSAGDSREEVRALGQIAMATMWGRTPVDEALVMVEALVERSGHSRLMEAFAERVRGGFTALTGDFEQGREHCRRAVEIYEDLGQTISAIGVSSELQRIERQAGRPDIAEAILRDAYSRFVVLGDLGYLSWVAPGLARILAERGRAEEATELARVCREELQRDHAYAQAASRLADATVLLSAGRAAEARVVVEQALAIFEQTDMIYMQADALAMLADVDRVEGDEASARAHVAAALALYELKGDVVSAGRLRERV